MKVYKTKKPFQKWCLRKIKDSGHYEHFSSLYDIACKMAFPEKINKFQFAENYYDIILA